MGQNGDAAFVRRICDLLEKRVIGHFVEPGQETPRQRYLTSFAVNGCVGSIEAWLQNGRTQSPEEMSAMTWDGRAGHLGGGFRRVGMTAEKLTLC